MKVYQNCAGFVGVSMGLQYWCRESGIIFLCAMEDYQPLLVSQSENKVVFIGLMDALHHSLTIAPM